MPLLYCKSGYHVIALLVYHITTLYISSACGRLIASPTYSIDAAVGGQGTARGQGTVNAKITEEKSKGAPKKGRKRFALSSRTKKCIPIVMAQESEICRIAQY